MKLETKVLMERELKIAHEIQEFPAPDPPGGDGSTVSTNRRAVC